MFADLLIKIKTWFWKRKSDYNGNSFFGFQPMEPHPYLLAELKILKALIEQENLKCHKKIKWKEPHIGSDGEVATWFGDAPQGEEPARLMLQIIFDDIEFVDIGTHPPAQVLVPKSASNYSSKHIVLEYALIPRGSEFNAYWTTYEPSERLKAYKCYRQYNELQFLI